MVAAQQGPIKFRMITRLKYRRRPNKCLKNSSKVLKEKLFIEDNTPQKILTRRQDKRPIILPMVPMVPQSF